MWFIGVEVERQTSAHLLKKLLDPPLKSASFFSLLSYIISVKCGVIQTFLYLLQAKLKSLILATASQFVERLY